MCDGRLLTPWLQTPVHLPRPHVTAVTVRYLSLSPQDSPGLSPLGSDGGASKADVDTVIEALKALKVEAGAAARWLQQALGAAGGAAREDLRQAFFFSGSGSVRRLALPAARCLRGSPSRRGAGVGQRSSSSGGSRRGWPAERQP